MLSVMTTDDLRFAVLCDDAKAIAKAPGIGAKTAQRVIYRSVKTGCRLRRRLNSNPSM